jgi:pyridoxal 5'-phosphate synthase pdxT subunit
MVDSETLSIGVIDIQGAVSEHVAMMKQVFSWSDIDGMVQRIKPSDSLRDIDGIILPGGESTTISRVLQSSHLFEELRQRALDDSIAVMGTCAGCILLSSNLLENDGNINLLALMSMQVIRNGYGRQKESFEQSIDISKIDDSSESVFPAVFIRAPVIDSIWGKDCMVLAVDRLKRPVMVQENNLLALTFHPELSMDDRIHSYFLSLVKDLKIKKNEDVKKKKKNC